MATQKSINIAAKRVNRGGVPYVYQATYSVLVNVNDAGGDPGAAGTYTLSERVPKGFIARKLTTHEVIAMAGGTNVTFKVASQALTSTIATAAFTGIDLHALTNADGLEITAEGSIKVTTVGTYTAGKINIFLEGYLNTEDIAT